VINVRTEMLENDDRIAAPGPAPTPPAYEEELRELARKHLERVRRLKINVAAWALGTTVLTTLWVQNQWQANGAFERFAHEGNPGDWNPTLWALGVGLWGVVVGIMALRVHFERPATDAELQRFTRARLERVRRLKFHVAAWVLGMIVLTPLWALIEWQDNGGFERWSNNSRPGDWEPWILYIGGIWALVIAIFALRLRFSRRTTEGESDRVHPGPR
jgi:hypothetical protein